MHNFVSACYSSQQGMSFIIIIIEGSNRPKQKPIQKEIRQVAREPKA